MSDIFREIDEELRRDNLLKLWARYGRYVVGLVIVVLVLAGAYVVWRDHQLKERQAQSGRFSAAVMLTQQGSTADAAKMFASVGAEGGGYGLLARFEEAALLARTGDAKGAVAVYDKIANEDSVGPDFRAAALLLSVMRGSDKGAAVIARLAPLTASGNPWRPSALELTALAKLEAGDRAGAQALYKTLADDASAPQGLRARAAEMVAALAP